MKTIALFVLLAAVVSIKTNAQDMGSELNSVKSKASSVTSGGMGSMIANFTDKISPSALTPEFLKNKKGFTDKANGTTDAKGSGTLLKMLENGIKSTAFQSAWAAEKPKFEAKASTIKSPKDVEEALKSLGSNIKPELMKKL